MICGDCRDCDVLHCLFDDVQANLVITSPPYASQRQYDPGSGIQPIRPEEYVAWFGDVATNIAAVLAPDGSYFLNIKEHCEDGQRHLYVKDLTIAHVRQWRWRFVDELCWRNTRNGVPGGWNNRFKNAWEPVFHFAKSPSIRFNPEAVSTPSGDVFEYSPDNPRSVSGSGLLGSGERKNEGYGLARHSNVIEVAAESSQGEHSAPFPRVLVEFFVPCAVMLLSLSIVNVVIIVLLCATLCVVTTFITPFGNTSKRIVKRIGIGEGTAMNGNARR